MNSDQTDWIAVRRYPNHHRSALARQAASLYPDDLRVRRTTLIAARSWLPAEPVDLADITMTWVPDAPPARVTEGEPETRALRLATLDHGQVTDLEQLPLRAAIGDPCDLSRRPVSVAITTLTLRREPSGDATFLLHWRDPAKVTHAAGMYQVMSVGDLPARR